jgi:hypothetical protein
VLFHHVFDVFLILLDIEGSHLLLGFGFAHVGKLNIDELFAEFDTVAESLPELKDHQDFFSCADTVVAQVTSRISPIHRTRLLIWLSLLLAQPMLTLMIDTLKKLASSMRYIWIDLPITAHKSVVLVDQE